MTVRALLRSSAIAACIVALAAPPGLAAAPVAQAPTPSQAGKPAAAKPAAAKPVAAKAASGGPMQVRIGQAKGFSRIEFVGARSGSSRREGADLVVTVSGAGDPDLSLLNIHPPPYVKAAKAVRTPGGLSVRLTLEEGAAFKLGQADGSVFLNVFPAEAPSPADPAAVVDAAPQLPDRPSARPVSGVVKVHAESAGGQLALRFPWAAPAAAAVFRRGDSVWVVFDAAAKLDLSQIPADNGFFRAARVIQGDGFSAVRFSAPVDMPVHAIGEGATWAIYFGPGGQPSAALVQLSRLNEAGLPSLQAALAGSTKVVWIDDPVVGDRIAAVTALQPSKGLPSRREFVEMALLPSMQGLAIEPIAQDVRVAADGDTVSIGRPSGLILSSLSAIAARRSSGAGLPQPASMPAVIDYKAWSKTGSGGFLTRYAALQSAVADEVDREANGKEKTAAARMALARFLAGSELYFETIGVLEMTAKSHPELLDDAEYRGLRGAAKVMAGRIKEAQVDFSAPSLAADPSAFLWRGYIDQRLGQTQDARAAFQRGQSAMNQFGPALQARFARADAEAALKLGDLRVAGAQVALAILQSKKPEEQLATRLVQGQLFEAQGHPDRALAVFDAVARAPLDQVAVSAAMRAAKLRLAQGKIQPIKAVAIFDGLRYRWRGDSTELEVIRSLGDLYLTQGRYREALEVLRSAGRRMPDDPQALQLQIDLQGAFKSLYLDGLADGLEPIQALAMFYDFRELTPIGADGDLMVRKLARRLVDVDLLDRAAELLKYQVDNRLEGVPKAQVATDLATIYLMDRKPEDAIQAINASRTTVLPAAMAAERRVIEARAWLALNDVDHAEELIGKDASAEATEIRADIAWRAKDWPVAAAAYEKTLGSGGSPLAPDQESRLLRAAVAYSLAGDEAALARLRSRYDGVLDQARSPDALKVALSPLAGDALPASFSKILAQDDAFAGWVGKMKQRFRDKPAPVSAARPKVAAAAGPTAG